MCSCGNTVCACSSAAAAQEPQSTFVFPNAAGAAVTWQSSYCILHGTYFGNMCPGCSGGSMAPAVWQQPKPATIVTYVPVDVKERLDRLEQLVADLIDVLRAE